MNSGVLRYFVAGTDTGIGKTWVSLLLIDALRAAGYDVVGFKPLACGADKDKNGRLVHEDALALQRRSSIKTPYNLVNPICLREPTAPHIAAEIDKRPVSVEEMLGHTQEIERHAIDKAAGGRPALVCEGVGGWDVPLNERESMADYACAIEARIVLVVGLRLGCLNHCRLSARAIRADLARAGGEAATARLCGLVVNCIEPSYPHSSEYTEALAFSARLPLLATVSHQGGEAIELPDQRSF